MPKVVVNLIKLDETVSFLEEMVKKNKDAMGEQYVLTTHSIDNEIKYLKDFKKTFDLAITKKQNELIQARIEGEPEACEKIKEGGGKIFVTDQYGNTFYPKPFEYSYVELTYGNYKKFDKVRFLGEMGLVILVRFQFENVEHNISPTTLKLIESIDSIREEYLDKGILEESLEFLQEIDELCERAKRGEKKKPKSDWKHFFRTYFYPSAKWKQKDDRLPKFKYEPKFSEKSLKSYLQEIENNKEKIKKSLENKRLESKADSKKENPSAGSKQDSDTQQPEIAECEDTRPNLLQGLEDALNNLNKDLERQIENWNRRFDPACIIKELKDCLLPPDLDFCDFLFKDISVPKFYQKIRLLKSAGLEDLYLEIDKQLETLLGVTDLKEKDREIKNLEKLLAEEDILRERLNETLESFETKSLEHIQEISSLEERLQVIDNNLEIANASDRISEINRLNKQKRSLEKRIAAAKDKLRLLSEQNESIPRNLEKLNTNYDEHLRRKGELKRDFADKIAENKFNERQAALIAEGRNLEAILLVPNEDEKYSSEALATTILNAVDTVIPLENLCKLLFSLSLNRDIKLPPQIPEDFWSYFTTRFKDPYFGLSVDFGNLIKQLLIVFFFNLVDAILKALCDAIGKAVGNSLEGKNLFDGLSENLGKGFIEQAVEVGGGAINEISEGIQKDISQAANKFFEFGQQSPLSEWDLSLDGKSFVIKNPPVFDLSQIENFIKTGITGFSAQAIKDMMTEEESGVQLEQDPGIEKAALTMEEAKSEISCILSRSMSLLTPTESMNLLTKNPDQNTKNIVNKIASICAPKISANYPGDSLSALLGEIGVLAGSLEVRDMLQGIADLDETLPITEKILCERYDNTQAFRVGLLSQTIDPQLASEILDEVKNKEQEQFGYIIDSITELAEGNILDKPQTAKQFYLEAISQTLDLQNQGEEPKSLDDLDTKKEEKPKINLKEIAQQKIQESQQNNAMLNSMFELTTESLVRPYKDRFRRDSENYLNAISTTIPYEKEVKKVQVVETPEGPKEVPTMEFLSILNMDYIPAVKITRGSITIRPQIKEQKVYDAKVKKEEILDWYKNNYENFSPELLGEGVLIFLLGVIITTTLPFTILSAFATGGLSIPGLVAAFLAADEQWRPIRDEFYKELKDRAKFEYEYIRDELQNDITIEEATVIKRKNQESTRNWASVQQEYPRILEKYKDKTFLFHKKIFGPDGPLTSFQLEELLKEMATIKLNEKTNVFSTSGVSGAELEFKLIPSYLLPVSKKIGDKTVLMSKEPDFNFLRDTSKNYTISNIENMFPAPLDFYISNGFVEEKYNNQFLNPSDYDKKENTILENKLEVGQKYKDSIDSFENIDIDIGANKFQLSISSKHKNNPLVLSQNNVPTSGLVKNESGINYDSIVSRIPTLESLQCAARSIGFGEQLPTEILDVLSKDTTQEKLESAITTWKIEYSETRGDNNQIETQFSLRTSGLSFSPSGRYTKFYHDTVHDGDTETIDLEIRNMLFDKYQEVRTKYDCFRDYIEEKQRSYIGYNKTKNIYTEIFYKLLSQFLKSYNDSRLLETQEETEQKLIELFDFTREQTSFEKENDLDPNIMNFVGIKKDLQQLYSFEKDDILTEEQLRGEKESENKFTKSAKNVLLTSMLRVCINEYILKNIFIFDSLSFSKEIEQFNFIIKDIANLAVQESKRVNIGKEIQQQSIKLYDLLVENSEIEESENIENSINEWKKTNSLSSDEANPKMIELTKRELSICLQKFRELLKCSEEQEVDLFIDSYISNSPVFDCPLINGMLLQEGNVLWVPFIGENYVEGDFYIEKYCRLPGLSSTSNSQIDPIELARLTKLQNKVIALPELALLLENSSVELEDFFNCESENNIFDAPIAIGARIMMVTNKDDVLYSTYTDEEIVRERSYVITEPDFQTENRDIKNQYFVSEISSEEFPIDVNSLVSDDTTISGALDAVFTKNYYNILYPRLTKNSNTKLFFKYCFGISELTQMLLSHCFLSHNDQDGRFLFEGTKMMIARMFEANMNVGNSNKTVEELNKMLEMQKTNEENTGNPLGPSLEAIKFFYRTPIQIMKGLSTIVDPNIALADLIVKGAAMAGNLAGQNINIPYSVASLALLPFPLFNGVAPPIPPLSSYNVAFPLGPIFLGLEPLLWDLPYYQNKNKGKLSSTNQNGNKKDNYSQNPLFCELSEEENDEE